MKKKLVLIAASLINILTSAQIPQSSYVEKEVFKNEDVVFRQIDEHTWVGNGHLMFNESLYLIEGKEKAILIDAGTKIRNLKQIVSRLTDKPITLVASHVHPDHTGESINDFSTIYINPADTVNIPAFMPNYKGKVQYLKEGEILDLGNRYIEVIFTPGHTPGSTTFIDKEARYGFSGDAFGSGNLLVFTNLSTLLGTCQKVDLYMKQNNIKYLYPGHYMGANKENQERVSNLQTLSKDILSGKRKGEVNPKSDVGLNLVVKDFGVAINYNANAIK